MYFNFGEAPNTISDEIDQAVGLFWRMVTDGGLKQCESICRRQGGLPR